MLVPCRPNSCRLYHQHDRSRGSPGAVKGAPRDHDPLLREQFVRPPLEVEQQPALEHEEELVLAVVLVPVELALEDAEPSDAVIHETERLVPPPVGARLRERADVEGRERRELHVGVDRVRLRHLAQSPRRFSRSFGIAYGSDSSGSFFLASPVHHAVHAAGSEPRDWPVSAASTACVADPTVFLVSPFANPQVSAQASQGISRSTERGSRRRASARSTSRRAGGAVSCAAFLRSSQPRASPRPATAPAIATFISNDFAVPRSAFSSGRASFAP